MGGASPGPSRPGATLRGRRSRQPVVIVPGAGLEPARPRGQRILSPPRLPIPPPGRPAEPTGGHYRTCRSPCSRAAHLGHRAQRSRPSATLWAAGLVRLPPGPAVAPPPEETNDDRLHVLRPGLPAARHGRSVGGPPVVGTGRGCLGGSRAGRGPPPARGRCREAPRHPQRPTGHLRHQHGHPGRSGPPGHRRSRPRWAQPRGVQRPDGFWSARLLRRGGPCRRAGRGHAGGRPGPDRHHGCGSGPR